MLFRMDTFSVKFHETILGQGTRLRHFNTLGHVPRDMYGANWETIA